MVKFQLIDNLITSDFKMKNGFDCYIINSICTMFTHLKVSLKKIMGRTEGFVRVIKLFSWKEIKGLIKDRKDCI